MTGSKTSVIFIWLLLICVSTARSQRKMLNKLFFNGKDSTRSGSFLPLPVLGYAPEKGWEFGAVTLYSFYADRQDTLIRNSTISGVATYTTMKQSIFQVRADIWGLQNNYHYLADVRYRNTPFNFYGIGDKTLLAEEDQLIQKLVRIGAEVEKKTGAVSYSGFNISFESYGYDDREAGGIYTTNPFITDRDGGKVLFLGLSQVIDTRNNNTYTTKGVYIKLNYSYAPDIFGGDNFEGSLTKLDMRLFKSFSPQTVLGINAAYQALQGNKTPFYLLPQLGNDQIMRGYYTGRYRNDNLLAAQAEFRYRFIPRLGVAAFLGGGTVYGNGTFDLSVLKPSYGAGLRYFFDVQRGLSIRFDYGMGEKKAGEKQQTGFYISLGEAF